MLWCTLGWRLQRPTTCLLLFLTASQPPTSQKTTPAGSWQTTSPSQLPWYSAQLAPCESAGKENDNGLQQDVTIQAAPALPFLGVGFCQCDRPVMRSHQYIFMTIQGANHDMLCTGLVDHCCPHQRDGIASCIAPQCTLHQLHFAVQYFPRRYAQHMQVVVSENAAAGFLDPSGVRTSH